MGNLKTFFLACLGLGIADGAGFYLYRKFTSTDEEEENSSTENATKEDPAKEDLSDVSKDDSAGFSNESQIEILVKADTSGPQNGFEKQQDNGATENPTATQKTTNKKDRTKNFGGLKKGFML